ncbi:hypothetical protein BC828DRAFT_395466 [Blastocladiella britannica]|nr:hypothetical protein BC828DRAFT_395466 [Blastocladiella britannica]
MTSTMSYHHLADLPTHYAAESSEYHRPARFVAEPSVPAALMMCSSRAVQQHLPPPPPLAARFNDDPFELGYLAAIAPRFLQTASAVLATPPSLSATGMNVCAQIRPAAAADRIAMIQRHLVPVHRVHPQNHALPSRPLTAMPVVHHATMPPPPTVPDWTWSRPAPPLPLPSRRVRRTIADVGVAVHA